MQEHLTKLKAILGEVDDLHGAEAVLAWDQETYMPAASSKGRSDQLATLSKMAHEKFASDEVGLLLEALTPYLDELDYDSDEAAIIRVTAEDYEKARKLPAELVGELTRVTSLATENWKKARVNNDFAMFQPHLQKVLDLTIQKAEAWGYEDDIYDALLDEYEPHMKSTQVVSIFNQVKKATVPLVKAIQEKKDAVNDLVLHQYYDPQQQWEFGVEVIKDYGFDFSRGRQDKSAHPFTISFNMHDVRITTRIMDNFLPSALFGTLHEAGHGIYEQGFADSLYHTGLADGTSLGIHESQSRMWENVIGRSKEFWSHYYPNLQKRFPEQLKYTNLNGFYQAINKVTPSLIRVEADEVTYNLHIFLRFEIERGLVSGEIKVADLPKAWNERMESYLGLVPDSDANGVLQDIHWSGGSIGYFPTYSLGNVISLQFFNQMIADNPNTMTQIANGDFTQILSWLKSNILTHGRKYTPTELIKRVTNGPLDATPYINYITNKYTQIYEL